MPSSFSVTVKLNSLLGSAGEPTKTVFITSRSPVSRVLVNTATLVVLLMGIAGFSSGTMSVNDKIVPEEGAVNVTYVDQKEQKQSLISIKGEEAKKFIEWSTLANSDIISNAGGKVEVNSDGLNKLRNRIASLSGETQLTTVEMDKSGNNTVITIEKMESVRSMVWMLFSIFPAIFALLIVFLTKLYPIKK